jgi:eukaryotic-like serine/threonine-protein kinase
MTRAAGTTLGSYKITGPIGAGGMGEVYQAHDTKLGRDVAIKVLPEAFAHDPERLSRFQREAKMLASLNHPNIATIHGLEQSNGTSYLVMELVSGETLSERIGREGAVPVEESLKVGVQIAEALEAAHEKGIIHRDLKPANVKVTPEGKVKVLDFGLAKAFEGDTANDDPSNSPTLSMAATMHGVILGTAAYMSPEQARGKAVDKRTDIWAFGCVLYELLTGKQTFHGEDVTDILAAVVRAEPDWTALPANISPSIRVLLQRCLRKDRRQRTPDAAILRIEIEDVLAAPATAEPTVAAIGAGVLGRRAAVLGLGALLLGAAIAGLAVWSLRPSPAPRPVTRTVITLPADQRLVIGENPEVTISPDGRLLAYAALQGGVQQLYLRAMDSLEAKALPGTDGAVNPFFSPDSQSLGFFAGGKLKKVSVNGGVATTLGDAAIPRGASWGSQGAIAFTPSFDGPVQQMPEAGGTAKPLTRIAKGDTSHRWPEALPDGQAVLFATGLTTSSMQVAVYVTGTGEQRILVPVPGSTQPRYAASGHLLYVQGSTLMAAPFDARRQILTGEAVPVVENVQGNGFGAAQYSISTTGSLVYVSGGSQSDQNRLVWVSRDGKEQPLAAPPRAYGWPRISPDGRKVTVAQDGQIWVYELARDTMTRFTFEGSNNFAPVWTPDGSRIAFQSNNDGPSSVFWQKADGSGGMEKLTGSEYTRFPKSWSADGQLLSFGEINPTTGYDIWVLDMKDRKAVPFLRTPFYEVGVFSPDGRWMAYTSNESGRDEVYVQPYPGPGGKWQISTDSGMDVRWTANGRELTYRNGDKMMAADIATQPAFSAGKPRMLFEGPYVPPSQLASLYDVSGDGQRFLMLKPAESAEAAPTQINIVLNWFEELKQKVPTGKK